MELIEVPPLAEDVRVPSHLIPLWTMEMKVWSSQFGYWTYSEEKNIEPLPPLDGTKMAAP